MVDESPSDALLAQVRLDEQRVQLGVAVGSRQDSGKADHDVVAFCDKDTSTSRPG